MIEYDSLKLFKTQFKFRGKKEYNEFFNEALIESPLKFINVSKQEFDERIHVAFSRSLICKCLGWVAMAFAALTFFVNFYTLTTFLTAMGLSILGMVLSRVFEKRAEDLKFSKISVIETYKMDNYKYLEIERKKLKKIAKPNNN